MDLDQLKIWSSATVSSQSIFFWQGRKVAVVFTTRRIFRLELEIGTRCDEKCDVVVDVCQAHWGGRGGGRLVRFGTRFIARSVQGVLLPDVVVVEAVASPTLIKGGGRVTREKFDYSRGCHPQTPIQHIIA